jgi:hypothetical protein
MTTEYMRAKTDAEREALARKIAKLRLDGAPWDGPGGIVDSMQLVSSATQGRALLRKFKLDAKSGGPVEILDSYDRFETNPRTGRRKGHREKAGRRPSQAGKPAPPERRTAPSPSSAAALPLSPPDGGDDARHAPINRLVRRIRRERNAAVPDADPQGPGVDAAVLVILRDPGRLGALATSYLSVRNPDRTAANQRRLLAAAQLPPEICLFWNAIPWDLGGRNPSSSDLEVGAGYLLDLLGLMTEPPTVVACGEAAYNVCTRARLDAIEICHPSDRGLRGGGINREPAHLAGLKEAVRRVKTRGRVSSDERR